MGQVNRTSGGEPRIFHRSLLTSTEERWECEDADWDAGECSAPPCSVPWEDRLADDFPDESGWYRELRQVFAPSQVSIGEQHVPIREHEPCLRIRVSSTVKWWWDQPCIEEQHSAHECKNDRVTKHFLWPEAMPRSRANTLFSSRLELFFFFHVGRCNTS